jgi:hypothetical protein
MTRTVRPVVLAAAVLALAAPGETQRRRATPEERLPAPAPPPDLRVRSALSQSAAWIGDPIEFVIELDTAPGVEIVDEDLAPEKLVIEGLELGAAASAEMPRADGWQTVRRTYRLTAWDTIPPKRINDLTVRFRRPVTAATADGSAPAAEVKVPGATLAIRSTLPDDGSAQGPRDRRAGLPLPEWLAWIRPLGLGLIALGIAPVVLWVTSRVRRPFPAKPRPSSRSLQAQAKALFDELQIIDTSNADGRRRAYDRIDADLRAYVAQAEELPAAALTADELRPRMAHSKRLNSEAVCDVLADCESARYTPLERLPDSGALESTVSRLRSALGQ